MISLLRITFISTPQWFVSDKLKIMKQVAWPTWHSKDSLAEISSRKITSQKLPRRKFPHGKLPCIFYSLLLGQKNYFHMIRFNLSFVCGGLYKLGGSFFEESFTFFCSVKTQKLYIKTLMENERAYV